MQISLLVIRCQDLAKSKHFYESLGLTFVQEQHGEGDLHYACEYQGCVFELYPSHSREGQAISQEAIRLGFKVSDLMGVIAKQTDYQTYSFHGQTIYLVTDPDGRHIELSAAPKD